MRTRFFVIAAAVVAGLSGSALAQAPSTAPANQGADPVDHWFASAYLGSNFGSAGSTALQNLKAVEIERGSTLSTNFGGEVGYMFGGMIGVELMANTAPNFTLSDTLLQKSPNVSAYMFNAIAGLPLREGRRFSPFVSGGVGGIHMGSTIFVVDPGTTNVNISTLPTTTVSATNFGWDLGGGVMAFNGPWGLRADVRYYKATTGSNTTPVTIGDVFLRRELSDLSFWNANFGVAFRF